MNTNEIEEQELKDFFQKVPEHLRPLTDDESVYETTQLERQANASAVKAAYDLGRRHARLESAYYRRMCLALTKTKAQPYKRGWLARVLGI